MFLPSSSSFSQSLVNFSRLDTGVEALVSTVPLGGKALEFGLNVRYCARSKVDETRLMCVPECVSLVSLISLFFAHNFVLWSFPLYITWAVTVWKCAHIYKNKKYNTLLRYAQPIFFLFLYTTTTLKLLLVQVSNRLYTLTFIA